MTNEELQFELDELKKTIEELRLRLEQQSYTSGLTKKFSSLIDFTGDVSFAAGQFKISNVGNITVGNPAMQKNISITLNDGTTLKLEDGSSISAADPTSFRGHLENDWAVSGELVPLTSATYALGASGLKWNDIFTVKINSATPLAGTKIYYVADSSGGAVTRKLTFVGGILTAET